MYEYVYACMYDFFPVYTIINEVMCMGWSEVHTRLYRDVIDAM